MENLEKFVIASAFVNLTSIASLANHLFAESSRVTILSDAKETSLDASPFSFPVTLATLRSNTSFSTIPPHAVVLHTSRRIRNSDLEKLRWNSLTKFLVITEEESVNNILSVISYFQICFLIILTVVDDKYKVYNYDFKYCDHKPKYTETDTLILTDLNNATFLEPTFQGCLLNISHMGAPPFSVYSGEGPMMGGHEGSNVRVIVERLGLNVTYVSCHESNWGLMEDHIRTKHSIAGFGSLFPFNRRGNFADLLMICYTEKVAMTAVVGAGVGEPTWFIILVSEFTPLVWLLTGLTLCFITPVSMLIGSKSVKKIEWPFHNFALLLGVPQNVLQPKIITLSCSIFGYIMTTSYQAVMSSKLTLPAKVPDLETVEDLAESNLPIYGPSTFKAVMGVLAAEGIPKSPAWAITRDNYQAMVEGSSFYMKKMVSERNIAFLRHLSNIRYVEAEDKSLFGNIHVLKDFLVEYSPATALPKYSCLTERFRSILLKLCDSGIAAKWYKDLQPTPPKAATRAPKKLSILHIKGFLFLLLFGWTLSVLAFVFEVVKFRIRRPTGKILSIRPKVT